MKKKVFFLVGLIVLLMGGYAFFSQPKAEEGFCAFCDSQILNAQTFYEDDLVLALYTHRPIFPGHCLVIPKRHLERFEMLSEEEFVHMTQVIKKVDQAVSKVFGTSSYLLLQKNGYEVGQSVPHVHFHYIPRKTGDDSAMKFILRMYLANAQKPIDSEQMEDLVAKMRQAMIATET